MLDAAFLRNPCFVEDTFWPDGRQSSLNLSYLAHECLPSKMSAGIATCQSIDQMELMKCLTSDHTNMSVLKRKISKSYAVIFTIKNTLQST